MKRRDNILLIICLIFTLFAFMAWYNVNILNPITIIIPLLFNLGQIISILLMLKNKK